MDDNNHTRLHTAYTPNIFTCNSHILCGRYNSILQMKNLRLREVKQFPQVICIPWRANVAQ